MSSLRLSKKHGINPSVAHCKLCGDSYGVVLFGASYHGGEEAPRAIASGHCDKCLKALRSGCVFFIEAAEGGLNERTGRMAAITKEAFDRMFQGTEKGQQVFLMLPEMFENMFGDSLRKEATSYGMPDTIQN